MSLTNGLEIAEAYFQEYGMPMLQEKFPELLPYVAAGLFGSGSECFGFDDELSRDHDFDPGFMLLLPGEDVVDRKQEFALERAYAKLPKEFMGVERPKMAPVGGLRRGVMRTSGFFADKTGSASGKLSVEQWLAVPSHALAEAVNGKVFYDGSGELSRIREGLACYPEGAWHAIPRMYAGRNWQVICCWPRRRGSTTTRAACGTGRPGRHSWRPSRSRKARWRQSSC